MFSDKTFLTNVFYARCVSGIPPPIIMKQRGANSADAPCIYKIYHDKKKLKNIEEKMDEIVLDKA